MPKEDFESFSEPAKIIALLGSILNLDEFLQDDEKKLKCGEVIDERRINIWKDTIHEIDGGRFPFFVEFRDRIENLIAKN